MLDHNKWEVDGRHRHGGAKALSHSLIKRSTKTNIFRTFCKLEVFPTMSTCGTSINAISLWDIIEIRLCCPISANYWANIRQINLCSIEPTRTNNSKCYLSSLTPTATNLPHIPTLQIGLDLDLDPSNDVFLSHSYPPQCLMYEAAAARDRDSD